MPIHSTDDDKYAKFDAAQRNAAPLKVTPPAYAAPPAYDDVDNKYAKAGNKHVPDSLKKYHTALDLCKLEKLPLHYLLFACFVIASALVFIFVIGRPFDVDMLERFSALQLEIGGLLMLRLKIKEKGSVSGISGMTIIMYAVTYFCRMGLSFPFTWSFEWKDLDPDITLGVVSFVLVMDILKSVFVVHGRTYQAELDVLKVWYLIPCCWTVSLLVRPHFRAWTFTYGYCWSSTLYMDVLALMPQVVMMAKAGGKVEAPIANFVAATSISRCGDLLHSLLFLGHTRDNEPFSYWMAVAVQFIHLLLVADFMYYYMKARASAAKMADEIKLVDIAV